MQILHVLALVFCALGTPSVANAQVIDRTMAVVNGDVLLLSDIEQFKEQSKLRGELDPFISFFQLRPSTEKEILNYLIQERIILRKMDPKEDEVEEEINNIQRNNGINREQLKQVLLSEGASFDVYKEMMRISVAKRKVIDRDLRPLAIITDEQVKKFYYTSPEFLERRKTNKLVLSYDIDQINTPNKLTADLAHERLSKGEDVESLVKQLEKRGVEKVSLGVLSEENLNKTIRKALESVGAGGVSMPIDTGSGYIILFVRSIGSPKDPAFEKIKEQLRNQLFRQSLKVQLSAWTTREQSGSFVHIP